MSTESAIVSAGREASGPLHEPRQTGMEKKLKHLEFIQGVVNRLASASFRVKGWSVVLVSALLVLSERAESFELGFVALLPVVILWGLDGYYLAEERLFRQLYDQVRERQEDDIDFSMDAKNLKRTGRFWPSRWWLAVRSRTLWPFYGALAVLSVMAAVFLHQVGGGE